MLPVFISYKRKDQDEVREIAQVMLTGGIRLWQDINSLGTGFTAEQVCDAIWHKCSALLFYATEESVKSEFIRGIELTEASERCRKNSDFAIVPIFKIPAKEADQALKDVIHGDISRNNGAIVDGSDGLREAARQARRILLQKQLQHNTDQKVTIAVSTYQKTLANCNLILDFDWSEIFPFANLFTQETWDTFIRPSLLDVKNSILDTGRSSLRIIPKAHLTVGLAFGFIFKRVTGFSMTIHQLHPQNDQWWSTNDSEGDASSLEITTVPNTVGSSHLAIEISISRDIGNELGILMKESGLDFGAILYCRIVPEPSNKAVPDGQIALTMVRKIADGVRNAIHKYRITDIHILAAVPLALAFLIGAELNACGRIHLYEVMTTGIAGGLDKALKGHSIHITPKGVFRTFSETDM